MLNVLINAYGCSPLKGSEGGLGWMWVSHLAKYCKIHVIAEAQGKEDVQTYLPKFEYKNNVQFHFVDIGERARKMCWNQGDWRFYYFYRKYQKKVYEIAKELHREEHFDIVHHLNMICFREPGYLWKLDNCKFVWGPIGGFTELPSSYLQLMPKKVAYKNHLKNAIRKTIIKFGGHVKNAFNQADYLMAASKNSSIAIKKYYYLDVPIVNETGLEIKLIEENKRDFKQPKLQIVWVGRFIATKFLDLALKSLAKLDKNIEYEFHILGDGENRDYFKKMANELGVNDHCIWHGMIPRDEVQEILGKSHLFFFTSLVEGTSHAVLEAIANKLPILCFDTCGHGAIVNERMGIKISVTNPDESIVKFAEIITDCYYNRERLEECTRTTQEDLDQLSWNSKAKKMVEVYESLVKRKVKGDGTR